MAAGGSIEHRIGSWSIIEPAVGARIGSWSIEARIGSWSIIEPAVGTGVGGSGKELRSINSCSLSSSLRENYISNLETSTSKGDTTVKCEKLVSPFAGFKLIEVGLRCQSWSHVSGKVRLTVCRCQRAVARCQASGVFRQLEVQQLLLASLVGGLIRTQIQVSTKQNLQTNNFHPPS